MIHWSRRGPSFSSAEELSRFVHDVRGRLAESGLPQAADSLADVQSTAFTTGTEWRWALEQAVRHIRKTHPIPAELDALLRRILREVSSGWRWPW